MISQVISIINSPPCAEILQILRKTSVSIEHIFNHFSGTLSPLSRLTNLISLTGARNRLTGDLNPLAFLLGKQFTDLQLQGNMLQGRDSPFSISCVGQCQLRLVRKDRLIVNVRRECRGSLASVQECGGVDGVSNGCYTYNQTI
jgi:hypothetical protein